MSLKRIYAVFLRQVLIIKSNPIRLVSIFMWTILDIIQWGFITKYLSTFGEATFNFITIILGAIILYEFMTRIQQGLMTSFLEDIWSQNFINFFASPLQVREYIAGLMMTSIATSIMGFIFVILIAGLAFGYNIFIIGWMILPFMVILFFFGLAMGVMVAAVIFRFGPSAEWIAWPIPFVLSIFSGVYFPITVLPVALRALSKIIPPAYVFGSMRSLVATGTLSPGILLNLLVGGILAIVYLVLAYILFTRIYRYNLKNGNIARFNAEAL